MRCEIVHTAGPIAFLLPESSGNLPFHAPVLVTAAARNRNRTGPTGRQRKEGHMESKANSSARSLGGWAMLADFSGLLLKASAAGLAASIVVGAVVLLVASLGG